LIPDFQLGERPWIAGHRGALPELENTVASFRRAIAEGASFVECDVQLAADGELVVFHDESLARLAGGDPRRVEELPSAALRELALPSPRAAAATASIPTLTELFAALPTGFPVNVELKRYRARRRALADAALATLALRENVLVSSFDWTLLERLREASATLPLAPIADRLTARTVEAAARIRAAAFHLGRLPDRPADLPLPVLVYTVNDPEAGRRLLADGAAGLITDRPGAIRTALGRPPR
jgi:glycerophosphoryl diester phosphodiesterase